MAKSPVDVHVSTPAELRERIAAEAAGVAFLVLRDGDGRQRIHQLPPDAPVTVGRGAGADVHLGWDAEVSRLHAELACVGGHWTVQDDGLSANGTWVNGQPLRGRRRLEDGDVILVGRTPLAIRAAVHVAEKATLRALAAGPPRVSEAQLRVLVALARPCHRGGAFTAPATNQAVADEVVLSVDAVKGHLRAMFERFGIAELPQNQKRLRLVELALMHGVVGDRDFQG